MRSKQSGIGYVPALDGMRGTAILTVMIFHSGLVTPFLQGGYIGVDIFFVLSGFLITSLIIKEYENSSSVSLKNFYMRRVLRLAPALLLLLFFYLLLSITILKKQDFISIMIEAFVALFYMSNWARAFNIYPPNYLGHTWSLSIEEQFYLLWPVTLLILLRAIRSRWIIAFIAFSIALLAWLLRVYLVQNGSDLSRLYNGLDTRADALMIGCSLGIILSSDLLSNQVQNILSRSIIIISPLGALWLLFISVYMHWQNIQMYYWGFFTVEVLVAILILDIFINKKSIFLRLFSMKWLVWIGTISYGLYLWHYPIYRIMYDLNFSQLEVTTVGTIITFLISVISFYFVEKPILKLKKRFGGTSTADNSSQWKSVPPTLTSVTKVEH